MPWTVASIVWPALVAALLPLSLADVIKRLPNVLDRFAAMQNEGDDVADDDRSRPRQLDDFRSRHASLVKPVA